MSSSEPYTFATQRALPFSPQRVYDAFARHEQLAQWWGPAGFTNTFESFEFTLGGRWSFVMHGPDGTDYPNENVFSELREPSRIVIVHVTVPHFVLTIDIAVSESGSDVAWTQVFDDRGFAEGVRHIVEPANEQNLDRLHAVLLAAS
jgi:uncharacterized protein YndB with AHSA1/START domain